MVPSFFTDYETLCERIESIDPDAYAKSRNHLAGAVTWLGPFVTHGVISTRQIAQSVLARSDGKRASGLLSQLGWREFFHRVWQARGDAIFADMREPQTQVSSPNPPMAVVEGCSGIEVVDAAVRELQLSGHMHNHARLWTAALACNTGRSHWREASRWMHYHLLDGDLASNTLSWQWVAGTFSQRKYIANQENINRFSGGDQSGTFIDIDYEQLAQLPLPEVLEPRSVIQLDNTYPDTTAGPVVSSESSVILYSIWNLDPNWRRTQAGRRVLLIEPDMHREFALSPLRWRFINHWARAIDGLEVFVGSIDELFPQGTAHLSLFTREYPATRHWPGERDARDWCYAAPERALTSFSRFWKDARKTSSWFGHE